MLCTRGFAPFSMGVGRECTGWIKHTINGYVTTTPVERVQAACRNLQDIIDARSDELTEGVAKALSDVIMRLHQQAPQWQSWRRREEEEDDSWLENDALDGSEELRAEERRKRVRQAERRRLSSAGRSAEALAVQ